MNAVEIGDLAYEALLAEVNATPKPGLVDRANAGAHTDMDHGTFLLSAEALRPWFREFARLGEASAPKAPEAMLPSLRPAGIAAEEAMFAATGGVNTHKGAIFSLGLLTTAAVRLTALNRPLTPEDTAATAGAFVSGICERELGQTATTKGERAYLADGSTGVRGEAESGFQSVLTIALPAYRELLAKGAADNDALCFALLRLIAKVPDTNIPTRLDMAAADYARRAAGDCLKALDGLEPGGEAWLYHLISLDRDFIERRISPGGCADLLACGWFLQCIVHNDRST